MVDLNNISTMINPLASQCFGFAEKAVHECFQQQHVYAQCQKIPIVAYVFFIGAAALLVVDFVMLRRKKKE